LEATSEERILSALSHLGLFFYLPGIIVALAIYFYKREQSIFVAQHAKQAAGFQIMVVIVGAIAGFGGFGLVLGGLILGHAAGVVGVVAFFWLTVLLIALCAVVGIVRALMGKEFNYPLVGELINKIV